MSNNAYDDDMGGISHTASIMDDTSVCLPHCDLLWFLQRFEEPGKPLGIILDKRKTTILTSTTGVSPRHSLDPEQQRNLQQALAFLSPEDPEQAEITQGVRFLGQPFTVDHLGGLGSFADRLLFPSAYNPHFFSTTQPPPWHNPYFGKEENRSKPHPMAFRLFEESNRAPSNLLTAANSKTKKFSYPEAHIYSIGHFAKASLGHAIVSALATHANNNIGAIRRHQAKHKSRTTQLQNLATPCFAPVTPIYSPAPMTEFIPNMDTAPLLCELTA